MTCGIDYARFDVRRTKDEGDKYDDTQPNRRHILCSL